MENLRKNFICKNQIKKGIGGVREIIKSFSENNSIALMIDQRVSEGDKSFCLIILLTQLPFQHNW